MRLLILSVSLLGFSSFAETTVSTITREVGADGQRYFSFVGKCPQSGSYHPIQIGKVEILKDKDGKNVKLAFEAPTISDYERKGVSHCAYKCSKGQEPVEIDSALMCIGLRAN